MSALAILVGLAIASIAVGIVLVWLIDPRYHTNGRHR